MGELKQVLKYLKGAKNLKLTLTRDQVGLITWYVDTSFAGHGDEPMGGLITFGHGADISFSQKQKLNTKDSTEVELMGVDDVLPQVLWKLYFVERQQY